MATSVAGGTTSTRGADIPIAKTDTSGEASLPLRLLVPVEPPAPLAPLSFPLMLLVPVEPPLPVNPGERKQPPLEGDFF